MHSGNLDPDRTNHPRNGNLTPGITPLGLASPVQGSGYGPSGGDPTDNHHQELGETVARMQTLINKLDDRLCRIEEDFYTSRFDLAEVRAHCGLLENNDSDENETRNVNSPIAYHATSPPTPSGQISIIADEKLKRTEQELRRIIQTKVSPGLGVYELKRMVKDVVPVARRGVDTQLNTLAEAEKTADVTARVATLSPLWDQVAVWCSEVEHAYSQESTCLLELPKGTPDMDVPVFSGTGTQFVFEFLNDF